MTEDRPKPFHSKRKSPHILPAEDVIETMKAIIEARREAEFTEFCRSNKITVRMTPRAVNLVKDHLFGTRAHKASETLRATVTSARCPQ